MEPALLFRSELTTKYELNHALDHFRVEHSRVACKDCLVIGRYSILPFYQELERDLAINNSRLINSSRQHDWIASFAYYNDLKRHTPETWFEDNFYQCRSNGPFVVKGKLKSKKFAWQGQMFAPTRQDALRIAEAIKQDTGIGADGVVFRRFVPLRTYAFGPGGIPYTNEWRCFYLGTRRLSYGYYWSVADCLREAQITDAGLRFADRVAQVAARRVNFFALDVAETQFGDWTLIEINDGQMSVLSENDPDELYGNLRRAIADWTQSPEGLRLRLGE